MSRKIIPDLGAHKGEDTTFYLAKGFHVVAVDASEKLCTFITQRLKNHPDIDHLTVLNVAIAWENMEAIPFYENDTYSVWGTIVPDWKLRNTKLGTQSIEKLVQATTLDALLQQQMQAGDILYYVKIDIEGMDMYAMESLAKSSFISKYLSWESEKVDLNNWIKEMEIAQKMGYTKFKLIDQSQIHTQHVPNPSKEGRYVDTTFERDASGLFGEELPGDWLSAKQTIQAYKMIFRLFKLYGDAGFFNNRWAMKNRWVQRFFKVFRLKFPHVGWYDVHAAR